MVTKADWLALLDWLAPRCLVILRVVSSVVDAAAAMIAKRRFTLSNQIRVGCEQVHARWRKPDYGVAYPKFCSGTCWCDEPHSSERKSRFFIVFTNNLLSVPTLLHRMYWQTNALLMTMTASSRPHVAKKKWRSSR